MRPQSLCSIPSLHRHQTFPNPPDSTFTTSIGPWIGLSRKEQTRQVGTKESEHNFDNGSMNNNHLFGSKKNALLPSRHLPGGEELWYEKKKRLKTTNQYQNRHEAGITIPPMMKTKSRFEKGFFLPQAIRTRRPNSETLRGLYGTDNSNHR